MYCRRHFNTNIAGRSIVAFALSASIAGLGGGLMASYKRGANITAHFAPEFGLVWVVLVEEVHG